MIKKILSFTLALCMILSVACLSAYAVEPANGGDEPELVDGYYEIANADQLYWFAEEVNSGNWSINGKLTADIVINEGDVAGCNGTKKDGWKEWTPIMYCNGTFDGAGHTISGLYFNDESQDNVGLFDSVLRTGTVKNLGVVNSYICGNRFVGGVASYSDGNIDNCYNTGTIIGDNYVGGVVGQARGIVSNCYNTGTVSGDSHIGGVAARLDDNCKAENCYNTGTVSGDSHIGGVFSCVSTYFDNSSISIKGCRNEGIVSGNEETGGLVGIIDSQGDEIDISIENCYNTALIRGVSLSNGYWGAAKKTGGLIGFTSFRGSGKLAVTNCYNTGTVDGIMWVGGLEGLLESSTNGSVIVENCYSSGTVSGNSNTVGGVFGYVVLYNNDVSITNCFYLKEASELARVAGILGIGDTTEDVEGETTGATLEQFKSGEVAYTINKNAGKIIYFQTIGKDSTPTLDETRGKVIFEGGKYKNEKKESEEDTTATQFFGSVELKGSELKAGQFKFELYDKNGKLVDTATNDADGIIRFSSVKLENAGNHTYTVKQKNLGASGIMYDSEVFTVTARASYDSNSELKAVVTIPKTIEFRNEYSTGTCSATLSAKVKLAGGELEGGEFSFNLRSGSGHIIKTVKNNADGSIDLSSVKFEKAGTFTYYVEQVKGKLADIEYDMDFEKITVTVTDDGKGNLTAKVSGSVTFENTYKD